MGDTASRNFAVDVARLLDAHKGGETRVLDLSGQSSWTDYFVITTVSSQGHLQGLLRHLSDFLATRAATGGQRQRQLGDDGWVLVDCGSVIVHLMDKEKREFYDLESLWFSAERIDHSSKSS